MNITLHLDTDSKETFEMLGFDKDYIAKRLMDVLIPIFKEMVQNAIDYGYANNKWMYPMKDYLAYSEKTQDWAEDFNEKVNQALTNEQFYVASDPEDFWRNCVYFNGRHTSVGIRESKNVIKNILSKRS